MFSANSSQVSGDKLFVEDVFSTYLYTGTSAASQTITNGIDLAGKGGLVWVKRRGTVGNHILADTSRGASAWLSSNLTNAQGNDSTKINSFTSSGFVVGNDSTTGSDANNYASWTFRKAPKFFDVVTYTGTGSFFRDLSHSLGVAPGFIVVKRTDTTSNWWTYHRGVLGSINGYLNLTNAFNNIGYVDPSPTPAATFRVFNTGAGDDLNVNGATYVAYLYAHDATSDGLIQCGTFTTDGSAVASVTLGWEPQWVMVKRTNGVANWIINDNMRGMSQTSFAELFPNTSEAEVSGAGQEIVPNATGFTTSGAANLEVNATYIYIAIRRGPMRTPTLGTSVYSPILTTSGNPTGTDITTGFPVDMQWNTYRSFADSTNTTVVDRLRGVSSTTTSSGVNLVTSSTAAQNTSNATTRFWGNTGYQVSSSYGGNSNIITQNFRRAPGFMDVVCYTGTGANRTINHNLGVAPELMIVKRRDSAAAWYVYATPIGTNAALFLNLTNAATSPAPTIWNDTAPTATVFTVGTGAPVNGSGGTFVNYLFASAPGVSKVGNYTGNGSSQTINCGFAAGARFVMIKRTDSTGDWYVWDSARGIVAGNDPHLSLNTTAVEVTSNDTIDTDSSGFVINQVAATNVNVNAATYIYLAIA